MNRVRGQGSGVRGRAEHRDAGSERSGTLDCPSLASRHSSLVSPGFTLLEVMLAVVIMAFVLVSLLGLQSRSVQDVMLAEHITTATLLAKRVMTETLLSGTQLPLEKDGTFDEEEFANYTWKKVVSPTPVPRIMEVRVAVLWKEGDREEQVELVSYE